MTDRAADMLADVLRSASSLAAVLDSAREVEPIDRAVPLRMVGMGSSRYAALTVAAALRRAGRPVHVDYASVAPDPRPGETVIAVSSSGATAETLTWAEARDGVRVIGVTNVTGSRLARATTDDAVVLNAGSERAGVATITYRATLAALALLTGAASGSELRTAVPAIASLLEGRDTWPDRAADILGAGEPIDVIADADRLGSAEQAALVLREAPRLRAEAREAGDWFHTAVYTVLPGHRVLLLGPSRYGTDLESTIAGRGGVVIRVGPPRDDGSALDIPLDLRPDAQALVRAIVESVAVDLLAAALWSRATALE